jgi:hypothetical protein
VEQLASLQGTILHNKIMLEAIFTGLEQKQILTKDEVAECANDILNKAWLECRWIQ